MMGPEVMIFTRNHRTSRTDVPMRDQGYDPNLPVVIEDDVWIGARAMILPGVHIGTGACARGRGRRARDVPDYALVAGNPARVVRLRRNPTAHDPEPPGKDDRS